MRKKIKKTLLNWPTFSKTKVGRWSLMESKLSFPRRMLHTISECFSMPKLPCQWKANKIIINKKNSNKKMIKTSPRFLHSSIKKEAANGLLLTLWLLVLMRRKSQRLHLLPTMKTKRQKEEKEEYQLQAILGLSFPV